MERCMMDSTPSLLNSTHKTTSFVDDLLAIKLSTEQDLSISDYHHLRKVIFLNRALLIIGFGTAWIFPNPVSIICIALALTGQWTIVAHHVCHGGYDNIPNIPKRYLSHSFAMGWRRLIDWLDWTYPPAWKYEHNTLHHFYLNELLDPDRPYDRAKQYVNPDLPRALTFSAVCLMMCAWKPIYYSINTLKAYHEKKNYNGAEMPTKYFKESLLINFLPYISVNFIVIPALFLPLGLQAVLFVFINRLVAEILTNIHTFMIIVPNHFDDSTITPATHFKNKEEFYLNQITYSFNYKTGGFLNDYLHGYLNYQIEHHLFPHLPASQYVKIQPHVKALCQKHGVEYKQESIFKRIAKTMELIMRQ